MGGTDWFRTAIRNANANSYGFQTVHHSEAVNDKLALVYSCGIREEENRSLVGVLGIIFNWEGLAQTIVKRALPEGEKENTRICICDEDGLVLADSQDKILNDTISFSGRERLFAGKKGFVEVTYNSQPHIICHAFSPGFETYATGYHSVIIQKITAT
jgi:hypothetical protein